MWCATIPGNMLQIFVFKLWSPCHKTVTTLPCEIRKYSVSSLQQHDDVRNVKGTWVNAAGVIRVNSCDMSDLKPGIKVTVYLQVNASKMVRLVNKVTIEN